MSADADGARKTYEVPNSDLPFRDLNRYPFLPRDTSSRDLVHILQKDFHRSVLRSTRSLANRSDPLSFRIVHLEVLDTWARGARERAASLASGACEFHDLEEKRTCVKWPFSTVPPIASIQKRVKTTTSHRLPPARTSFIFRAYTFWCKSHDLKLPSFPVAAPVAARSPVPVKPRVPPVLSASTPAKSKVEEMKFLWEC